MNLETPSPKTAQMKISIVIPVYNVSEYIEECVHSVMEQTYPNLECILVDDGSKDDSLEKCTTMVAGYQGPIAFKILHHNESRGPSAGRNTGLAATTGDYIYYLDSDDFLPPDAMTLLAAQVEKHPDVEYVEGAFRNIPESDNYSLDGLHGVEYVNEPFWARRSFYLVRPLIPMNPVNKLLRKDFLLKNNLTFKEGLLHEDELWFYWLSGCVEKVAFVYEPTYVRRVRHNSIMTTRTEERSAHHLGIVLEEIMQDSDSPCFDQVLLWSVPIFLKGYGLGVDTERYEALYQRYQCVLKQYHLPLFRFYLFCCRLLKNRFLRRVLLSFAYAHRRRLFARLEKSNPGTAGEGRV